MAQLIDYPKLPGTEPENYQPVIQSLLTHVENEKPTDKDLRRHMRSRTLYDKDDNDGLLDLIGIRLVKGKPASLTSFGKKLMETTRPEQWKRALFMELAQRNEILVKFVFDSLTERLYSVNEMYRGVTSYAYPGKSLTLPNFKNWMQWIQATGMLKYIGIRWGLSDLAKSGEIDEYIAGIDIEEILEEEAEAEVEAAAEAEEEVSEQDDGQEDVAEEALEATEEEDELPPDLPPEPVSTQPAPTQPAPSPAAQVTPAPASAPAKPVQASMVDDRAPMDKPDFPTYRSVLTLRSVAEIREVQKVLELDPGGAELARRSVDLDDAELASNLGALRDMWLTAKDKSILGLDSFGLDPADYKKGTKKNRRSLFVYRAILAATCVYRPHPITSGSISPSQPSLARFKLLNDSGALTRHFDKKDTLDNVLSGLVEAGYANRLDVLALIPYMGLLRQALEGADQWLTSLESADPAEDSWQEIYKRLHVGLFDLELIWLVREMHRHGLWPAKLFGQCSVVPEQEVMDIAFRIGVLPTPYLGSFTAALHASRTLTGFVNLEYGYEAGLKYFGHQLGCSYDCSERGHCKYYCREKLRR